MLDNAQVTISLKDFEKMQSYKIENEKLIKSISSAVGFDFKEYENKAEDLLHEGLNGDEYENALAKEKDLATVYIDYSKIIKIILSNCYEGKTEEEISILEDVMRNDQVKVLFAGVDYGDNK